MTTKLGVLALALLAASVALPAQEPAAGAAAGGPVFRASIDVVQFDVSVLDRDGVPVRGLTAGDFTVFEDGLPRPLVAFSEIEIPKSAPDAATWTREVAPDVATNHPARRAVVILLDDVNTRWDPGVTRTAKSIAMATIDSLGPADLTAVVFAYGRRLGQEFTTDRARLRAAIERFVPSGLGPQPSSQFSASTPGRGLTLPATQSGGRTGACADDCVHMALRNVAEILRSWPGVRKTLVLIGPGKYDSGTDALEALSEQHPLRQLLTAMQEANAHAELDAHLSAAKAILGDDARLLLYEGTRHHVYAHPRAQALFAEARRHIDSRVSPRGGIPRDFAPPVYPSITGERIRAEEAFRRAVRLAPDLAEARIRLAHVLTDRAQYRDALRELNAVSIDGEPSLLAYYARVIEGRARRGLGELEAAEAAFARALSLYPDSQIPRLASSEIALALGRRADARAQLASLPDTVDDPWWRLPRLHANVDDAMQAFWQVGR